MKTNQPFARKLNIFYLLLIFFAVGCKTSGGSSGPAPSCIASVSSETTSINGFDANPASPFFNKAVANFQFSQVVNNYPNNCQLINYGSTSLKITSAVNKTMSFNYQIVFVRNAVSWQYQGIASIPPNSTIDVGIINSGPTRVNGGTINIQSSIISYK